MMKMLHEEEVRKIFQAVRVMRLGCIINDHPYVVPISGLLEDEFIYSHSLPGLKITALRTNPSACVQADEIESDLSWRSAIAFGKFEEVKDEDIRGRILGKLLRRFPMLTPVESAIAIDGASPQIIVYRIHIERLTGVSEG